MRILIWSPNYAPELLGIPPLVTDAAEWLARRGHEVRVATAFPNYPERRIRPEYRGALWRTEREEDVTVSRSWLRVRPNERFLDKALYELTFTAFSLPAVLRRLRWADVVVCLVPSLLAASVAASAASVLRSRARVVLWVQDIVAEAAAAVEIGDVGRRAVALAGALDSRTWRRADAVIVCSPGFRERATTAGVAEEKVAVVLNWARVDALQPRPLPPPDGGPTRFLYSGNLGYTQGFPTLVEAAAIAGDDVFVEIVGAGNAAADVARLAEGVPNVAVKPPVAEGEYPGLLASAHAHLVLQRALVGGANLPSKIGSYLASGRAVVGSLPLASPAADLLRRSGAAVLVEPEQPEQLARELLRLHEDPRRLVELGATARDFALAELSPDSQLERFEAILLGEGGRFE
jgi:colanic acid biosynthesis glycosyl transferase WcaI